MAHSLPHDQRIAATNKIFREMVVPNLPEEHGAMLLVFQFNQPHTFGTYISNAPREYMRKELRQLLNKWDAEADHKNQRI